MSHIVSVKVQIKDLDAVQRACQRLGWSFHKDRNSFKWFGLWVGDSNYPRECFTKEEQVKIDAMSHNERCKFMTEFFATCDHVIGVPGCNYEIGLKLCQGSYQLLIDAYDAGGLDKIFGYSEHPENGTLVSENPFVQAYAVEAVKLEAENNGYTWKESSLNNGKVMVELFGV